MITIGHSQEALLTHAQILVDADVGVPAEFYELRTRLQSFCSRMDAQTPRLVATLLDVGTPLGDLGPLIADALAEQSEAVAYGRLNSTVTQALGGAILNCLSGAANAMYGAAAKAFDQAVVEAIDAWTIVSTN